jgi:superfamily I DNA and RNA helicase
MLDIVTGQRRNVIASRKLVEALGRGNLNGTLYIGYPILSSVDGTKVVEGLLTSEEHGVVVFDLLDVENPDPTYVEERQNDLYAAVFQKLMSFKPLRSGRGLKIEVNVLTLSPNGDCIQIDHGEGGVVQPILDAVQEFRDIAGENLRLVNAAIQRVGTIKPFNKRQNVTNPDSRGAVMRKIEGQIANLDRWQKHAAIESPEGPQRIRGLAGSGKTIVLALKAAYLHGQHPEWDLGITFQTRSLYQQFKDLVRRFCFEQFQDEPDWTKLRILHAWGSSSRQPGVYSEIAASNGLEVKDFSYAKLKYGADTGFEGICQELLAELKQKAPAQLFDAILIDEAQDLPHAFFELVYMSTRPPKRIIWAYDELQNLGSYSMVPPQELFGKSAEGVPHVPDLHPLEDGANRDIVLPVCYRNTPWTLTTAHALGFGIYRKAGPVQFFDNPGLLQDVGYRVLDGELELGHDVVLARREDSSPSYFAELLQPTDAVKWRIFESPDEQAIAVAQEIHTNLTIDELDPKDILVILANPLTARDEANRLIQALSAHDITAHLAGVMASVDQLFQDDSIAMTGIYRAKGNEAPMVYLLNSEYCAGSARFISTKARNILFTAITRSRAWVRVYGSGESMTTLGEELTKIVENQYRLAFKVPTREELEKIRRIHRDISREEIAKIQKVERGLSEVLEMIRRGEVAPDDLSPEIRTALATLATPAARDAE